MQEEEIAFEVGNFCTFRTSVTLTLTLDRVIRHTFMYHSSTSLTQQISLNRKKVFVDGRTTRPALLGRPRVDMTMQIGLTIYAAFCQLGICTTSIFSHERNRRCRCANVSLF